MGYLNFLNIDVKEKKKYYLLCLKCTEISFVFYSLDTVLC